MGIKEVFQDVDFLSLQHNQALKYQVVSEPVTEGKLASTNTN